MVAQAKYLTFVLADEQYGLEITRIREIVRMMEITGVPGTPDFLRGVINLRGRVVPVVELRRMFGLAPREATPLTCILVAALGQGEVGMIVDRVCEVADLGGEDIAAAPALAAQTGADFVLGISKGAGKMTVLLDLDKVFARSDAPLLPAAARGGIS